MNRLDQLFQQKSRDILNVFLTAGFPKLNDTVPVILALERAGVDMVEVGMPYSDPLADGPTIQASSIQALRNGMHLDLLFEQIQELRKSSSIPVVLMGYFNQVIQYGEIRFVKACLDSGVDGLILPDLPLIEYERAYQELFEGAGLRVSLLICPDTPEERVRRIDSLTSGFLYMVSDAATTGGSRALSSGQLAYFQRIAEMQLRHPRLIGFGISDRDAFNTACSHAHGAIIGSAFLRAIDGKSGSELEWAVRNFVCLVRGIPAALR